MGKLLVIAALVVLGYYMLAGRWPWEKRLTRREQALAKARKVLGLASDAERPEIIAAHRRLVAQVHPDRGGSGKKVHEVNEARDLLLAALPAPTIHEP